MRTAKALLLTFCLANVFFSASNLGSVITSSYKTIEKKKIHVDYAAKRYILRDFWQCCGSGFIEAGSVPNPDPGF
jgi:hypothetical protein